MVQLDMSSAAQVFVFTILKIWIHDIKQLGKSSSSFCYQIWVVQAQITYSGFQTANLFRFKIIKLMKYLEVAF